MLPLQHVISIKKVLMGHFTFFILGLGIPVYIICLWHIPVQTGHISRAPWPHTVSG